MESIKEFTHENALLNAMKTSGDWKNHKSHCDSAQVMFLKIDGKKIIANNDKSKLLDDVQWRKGLEEKSKLMLSGNREGFFEKTVSLKSENFVIDSNFTIDSNQLLTIECKCGEEVNLDSKLVEMNVSSHKGDLISPKKIGKMNYE